MSPAQKRKTIEMVERRQNVTALYLRHVDQTTIAQQIGVTQSTVSRDITALTQYWLRVSVEAVEAVKARELAELDDIERECAMQFAVVKDPAWLDRRLKCKERRAKLLGLDAPTKVAPTDVSGTHPYPQKELAGLWRGVAERRRAGGSVREKGNKATNTEEQCLDIFPLDRASDE